MHAATHLCIPTACSTLRLNPSENHEYRMIMLCPLGSLSIITMSLWWEMLARNVSKGVYWKSMLSPLILHDPQSALKLTFKKISNKESHICRVFQWKKLSIAHKGLLCIILAAFVSLYFKIKVTKSLVPILKNRFYIISFVAFQTDIMSVYYFDSTFMLLFKPNTVKKSLPEVPR